MTAGLCSLPSTSKTTQTIVVTCQISGQNETSDERNPVLGPVQGICGEKKGGSYTAGFGHAFTRHQATSTAFVSQIFSANLTTDARALLDMETSPLLCYRF